jgi:hypothetical protein
MKRYRIKARATAAIVSLVGLLLTGGASIIRIR